MGRESSSPVDIDQAAAAASPADAAQPLDATQREEAYFPRRYLTDFFEFLKANSSTFQVVTYADLLLDQDRDYESNYTAEYRAWRRSIRLSLRNRRKIFVLLQYDVDSRPERSMDLLRTPEHEGIPANVMIFNRRISRPKLRDEGELVYTDYELDHDLLQRLERQGSQIAYHCNAMEQAKFDMAKALEIFDSDVRQLSQRYNIRFFSAHGGVRGPCGEANRTIEFHPDWVDKLRWVHNGHTVRFNGSLSDGSHHSGKIAPENRDLRDFVRTFKSGNRYRILLHPQYYDTNPRQSRSYSGTTWYDELLQSSRDPQGPSLWSGVDIDS